MLDYAIVAIWGLVAIAVVLGGIPYVIWVIYTAFHKRWRKLAWQIGIPIGAVLLLAAVTQVLTAVAAKSYRDGLFDADAKLGKPLFEYHSERSFNGDGYSISVYELTPAIRARFESPDKRLLTEFPRHPSYRNHWKFEPWREAPFDNRFEQYLDFALAISSDDAPGLEAQFAAIRRALTKRGTFYAFFYNDPSGRVGDVDFFVVDLNEGRIYLINLNT